MSELVANAYIPPLPAPITSCEIFMGSGRMEECMSLFRDTLREIGNYLDPRAWFLVTRSMNGRRHTEHVAEIERTARLEKESWVSPYWPNNPRYLMTPEKWEAERGKYFFNLPLTVEQMQELRLVKDRMYSDMLVEVIGNPKLKSSPLQMEWKQTVTEYARTHGITC